MSSINLLVYDFLVKCNHAKAAKRFRKQAGVGDDNKEITTDLLDLYLAFKVQVAAAGKKRARESSSDSDSSDSSDSESSDSSDSDSSDEDEEDAAMKRLKAKQEEKEKKAKAAAKAAEQWLQSSPVATFPVERKKKKKDEPRVSGEAFKRVDAEVWGKEIIQGLDDNSYEKQFGKDGYGFKAHSVLITVKGKDFRHEKTKRKRSTYRGGEISFASNSFKYED